MWGRMVVLAATRRRGRLSPGRQGGDLHEVVGEDSLSAPGGGAVAARDAAAGPAVAVFEVADAAFAAGSPLDEPAEAWAVFGGPPGRAGLPFSRYGDGSHADLAQVVVDSGLAIAAVGGHRAGHRADSVADPPDRRGELRRVGG